MRVSLVYRLGICCVLGLVSVCIFSCKTCQMGQRKPYSVHLSCGSMLEGFSHVSFDRHASLVRVYLPRLQHVAASESNWRILEAVVPQDTVLLLDELVADIQSCDTVYERTDLHDGEQWCLVVDREGDLQYIYCNNVFPKRLKRLKDLLFTIDVDNMKPVSDVERAQALQRIALVTQVPKLARKQQALQEAGKQDNESR